MEITEPMDSEAGTAISAQNVVHTGPNPSPQGMINFTSMIQQADKNPFKVNQETYIGPVEIRKCDDIARGRGLFLTKDVKVGDVLICEKAFATVSVCPEKATALALTSGGRPLDTQNMTQEILYQHLADECFSMMAGNPSLVAKFNDLCSGAYKSGCGIEAVIDPETHLDRYIWNLGLRQGFADVKI